MEILNRAQKKLSSLDIDGLIVTNATSRRYLTGFTGSNGIVIISENDAVLVTDYRYVEIAKEQTTGFDVVLHADHTGHKGSKSSIYKVVVDQINKMGIKRLGF